MAGFALGIVSMWPTVGSAGQGLTMTMMPVRASGVECASSGQDPATCDWFAPGGNQILLNRGNQDVSVEVFFSDWDPNQNGILVAAYQAALDCATFPDATGSRELDAISLQCFNAPGGFSDFCLGVDTDRSDYILNCCAVFPACNNVNLCPNGVPGHFICGSVNLSGGGGSDSGTPAYAATFAVHVPLGVASYQLGIDLDPTATLTSDEFGGALQPISVVPAGITVRCASSADCDDGIPCTQDTCSTLFGVCQNPVQDGACLIAGLCASQGDDNPANDCETCDPATASDAWSLRPVGDACGASGAGDCVSLDVCDGLGTCLLGEVSLFDFAELSGCLTGPKPTALTPCCATFDVTPDSDVDLVDFAEFQQAFTGP